MLMLSVLLIGCQEYKIGERNTDEVGATPTDTVFPPPSPGTPTNYDAPEALCEVSNAIVSPPYEAVELTGDADDPNGLEIVAWAWSLANGPGGSDAMPTPANAQVSSITPDLAGIYEIQLVVTNSAGIDSTPCTVQVESISAQDLRIEMFWDQSGDDMDLHLLAPGGSLRTSSDCYYNNCDPPSTLDWGVLGYANDDPQLDLDDVVGDGPENINILQPENGIYTVVVNDFGNDVFVSTNVTVNIYLDGSLAWTDSRDIFGDLNDEFFAEINWATRTVTGL